MTPKRQRLFDALKNMGLAATERSGELTVEVKAAQYKEMCTRLRDDPATLFEQCMDLTGVDFASYGDRPREGPRFAVSLHLLSLTHNWRLRVRAFCPDDQFPQLPSLSRCGRRSTGTSAKRSISSASCSRAIPTCGAS